jgi:hypothetical protein
LSGGAIRGRWASRTFVAAVRLQMQIDRLTFHYEITARQYIGEGLGEG